MDTPLAMTGRTAVLCVEDGMSVIMLHYALASHNVRIVGIAVSGGSVLAKVRERRPDVVVIDGDMPDMAGEQVARAVSAEHPCGIVMLLPPGARGVEIEELGVAEVVQSPFTLEDLAAVIARVLGNPPR